MPTKTLYPYQIVGRDYLAENVRAILGDEMGIGKSGQAATAAEAIGAERVLVVCPASLRVNWAREFRDFCDRQPKQLEIVSYDKARDPEVLERLQAQVWDVLICDEAHYLKSKDAKRTIAALDVLAPKALRVWLLSGTPMPNNPSELWTLVRCVGPEHILKANGKPMSFWDFRNKFCHVVNNGSGDEIKGGRNLDQLARIMSKIMLRRTKDEVLDLPPLFVGDVFVEAKLSAELKGLEEEFGPEILAAIEAFRRGDEDALKRVAPHVAKLRRVVGLIKAPAVAAMAADLLEGNEKQQLIIFAWHTEVVEIIKAALIKRGFSVGTIVGSDSQPARRRVVDQFQAGQLDVVIGNIQAAGVGLTLTASNHEIFAESSWVPADNAQALMRAHRISQTRAVTAQFAVLAGSLDEVIQAAVTRKARDFAQVFAAQQKEAAQ